MTFETEETNRHLRAQLLQEGREERMRAVQALSHGYGTGSRAALAGMLLAALGGERSTSDMMAGEDYRGPSPDIRKVSVIGQIAEPMQHSANDAHHSAQEVSSGY